jgi:hypothetical protein
MDTSTQEKWDRAARSFDLMAAYGPEWRWKPAKQQVFERMNPDAKILFLGKTRRRLPGHDDGAGNGRA